VTEVKMTEFERALDEALGRALHPPRVPHDFPAHLSAALYRADAPMAIAWGGTALGLGIGFFEPLRRIVRQWSDPL
jgi:hypothetical protein